MTISGGNFGWEAGRLNLTGPRHEYPRFTSHHSRWSHRFGEVDLLQCLLGEIPISQGQVVMEGTESRRIGYCDQTPYLSNASIRDNIVGFAPYNRDRYQDVVEATMLEPDLATLPHGDRTKVGSDGIALSGGQKQRVSMARALYLDSDLLVFDDILSGLDADTEEQVFIRGLWPRGPPSDAETPRPCCALTRSRHLPSADHIVALGTDAAWSSRGPSMTSLPTKTTFTASGLRSLLLSSPRTATARLLPRERDAKHTELVLTVTAASAVSHAVADQNQILSDSTVYMYYFRSLGVPCIVGGLVFAIGWGFFSNWGKHLAEILVRGRVVLWSRNTPTPSTSASMPCSRFPSSFASPASASSASSSCFKFLGLNFIERPCGPSYTHPWASSPRRTPA